MEFVMHIKCFKKPVRIRMAWTVHKKDSVSAMNKDLESQIEGFKRSQSGELKNLLMNKSIAELKTDLKGDVEEALLVQLLDQFVTSVDVRA